MSRSSRPAPALRAGTVLVLAVALSLSNVAFAEAASITPDSVNPWQHFSDCLSAMMNDSAAHQANCGPGQTMPNSNSTLALPVYGGQSVQGCSITPASLDRPLFEAYGVASLDDSLLNLKGPAPTNGGYLLATPAPCGGGCLGMTNPLFAPFDTASLDDSVLPPGINHAKTGAGDVATCCDSSLQAPLFVTYQTASLDNSIAPSLLDLSGPQHKLVACR